MIGNGSNCWGFEMVGHRVARSWLRVTCIALGVEMDISRGSTDWHHFSGLPSSGAQSLNGAP